MHACSIDRDRGFRSTGTEDIQTGKVSEPVSPATKGKHPVAVGNARGEVLLAWTEGAGWGRGGAGAW